MKKRHKYKCKICERPTGNTSLICWSCEQKQDAVRGKGKIFKPEAEVKLPPPDLGRRVQLPRPDTYSHKLGSETRRLVDFVNKSGTIHYGREVARQKGLIK